MLFVMQKVAVLLLMMTLLLLAVKVHSSSAQADNSVVVLMYHHIDDDTPAVTSTTPATFNQHIQYLAENRFTVWPLSKTLQYLSAGRLIPKKTVVLTFDDAYISVYKQAFPLLKEKGWPFTVFVTGQYTDASYNNYMNWDQLREIQQSGAEVGNHSLSHPHFIRQRLTETDATWRARIISEVQQTQQLLRQQLSHPVRVLAYPYGEYNVQVKALLREMDYFGIGQHSGAISYTSDMQALPRFPMATGFDSLDDFAIKVATKNLPVTVLSPADGVVSENKEKPVLIMRLENGNYKADALACYTAGQGKIKLEWIDPVTRVVSVIANEAIKAGRTKYNCTAPSKTEAGVFYWFSFLWMKPEASGNWYSE